MSILKKFLPVLVLPASLLAYVYYVHRIENASEPNAVLMYLFLAMGGMVSSISRRLMELDRVHYPSLLRVTVTSPDFLLSLMVSPMTFLAALQVLEGQADPLLAYLLAFQNGFFWKVILERAVKSSNNSSGPSARA